MRNSPIKIIFTGTGEFAAIILEKIIQSQFLQIGFVITSTDKPAGREKKIVNSPVKETALKYSLPIIQPQKISDAKKEIARYAPDFNIVADYGQIIPKDILEIPKFKSINIHPSLLPKYRGPSPIQTAIINGDKTTGATIMLMDEKMDHGPIISQRKITIIRRETTPSLEKKIAKQASALLLKILPLYISKKVDFQRQNDLKASYTKMLTRQDGKIDFKKESAQSIEQKIRGLNPWPGVWTIIDGKRVKIIKAKIIKQKMNNKKQLIMVTKKGYLELEEVQPEGKKPMTGQSFQAGRKYC